MSKPILNQSKNIVISTQCFSPVIGGMENLMTGLANYLHKNKFKVYVFADSKNKLEEEKYDRKLPYEIVRYGGLKIIRKNKKSLDIKKFINFKKNINSIICDSWKSAEKLVKKKIIEDQKLFCLAHGNDILINKNIIKKKRIKNTLVKANYIIANSFFTKKRIIDLGIKSNKIKVIYPGLNNTYSKSNKKNKNFNKYKRFNPILLTIARLEKRKNHINIIYAIKDLVKDFKNLIYLIAGDGSEMKKINKLIKKLNIKNNIITIGEVNDFEKSCLLRMSDIYIMPTLEDKRNLSIEGFGISYIEAAMHGIPSISSGIGGSKESVINGKTGLFCNPEKVSTINLSIRKLATNKEIYKKMSKNSLNFSKKFLWKNTIKQYVDLIKKDN